MSRFGPAIHVWSLAILDGTHSDPLRLSAFCWSSLPLGGLQIFFVLLIILCATWYTVCFGPQCPLWFEAHEDGPDIVQVDMSKPECLLALF